MPTLPLEDRAGGLSRVQPEQVAGQITEVTCRDRRALMHKGTLSPVTNLQIGPCNPAHL